jgi:hypothetical protein
MQRRYRIAMAFGVVSLGYAAFIVHARLSFPAERTPEGAYARIAVAITDGRPRDCFAYLETEAQWASYSVRDFRQKARALVGKSYPEPERTTLMAAYEAEANAADGADGSIACARISRAFARSRSRANAPRWRPRAGRATAFAVARTASGASRRSRPSCSPSPRKRRATTRS